ncbi:FtsW/RodA/SpoVE family cell cycle protein [bacterium]|nr:FtsW/RodA/SpoVE family cell cycle protein [bacterium]
MRSTAASGAVLMGIVTVILAYGGWALSFIVPSGRDVWLPLEYAGLIAFSAWIAWGALALCYRNGNHNILPLTMFIITVAWLETYRLGFSTEDFSQGPRQAVFIAAGLALFLAVVVCLRDYRILEDYKYIFLILALLIQISVMLFGMRINGATLWVDIGGHSFQPFEFTRILLVFFLASYLRQFRGWLRMDLISENWRLPHRAFIMLGLGMAAAEILLVVQRDLGMALLLFGIFVSLFYAVTNRKDILALAFGLSSVGAYFCWRIYPHVQERVSNWLDPFVAFDGSGYQICQAIFSLANAGLDGTGLGLGGAAYIPAVVNDFTFVAIAEEFGIMGAGALLAGMILLFAECFGISLRVKDEFGSILAAGLVYMLAWQSLINLLGVTKVLPMTGVALPFVSAGGTSMLSCFAVLALLWRIDISDTPLKKTKRIRRADGASGTERALEAENGR